jgi:spore coat protein U-like protein
MKVLRHVIALITFVLCALAAGNAQAQVCTATSTGMSFGSYSPVTGTPSVSATIAIKCSGLLAKVRVCVALGPGVGQTSYAPRYMTNGVSTLQYNLYSDSAGTSVVGSTLGPYAPAAYDLPVNAGAVNTTVTVYGKILPTQSNVQAGSFGATFGSTALISYQTLPTTGTFLDCLALSALSGSFSFPVTANVINDCTISASNIDFGSKGLLSSTLTAAGSLSVACTNSGAYAISLSAGNGVNATSATRYMTLAGASDKIGYGLYPSASYSVPWGDGTSGSTTVSGTGNGATQSIPVYSRVLPQPTPPPGSYSDTVIATVIF